MEAAWKAEGAGTTRRATEAWARGTSREEDAEAEAAVAVPVQAGYGEEEAQATEEKRRL